jgi:hypothetical protein
MAFALVPGGAAERDAVVQRHVVADLGGLADHHSSAVVDEETPAQRRTGMDVDIGDQPGEPGQQRAG